MRVGIADESASFSFQGNTFKLVRKTLGNPVSSSTHNKESVVPEMMILSAPSIEAAQELCKYAMEHNDLMMRDSEQFRVFTWNAQGEHWHRSHYISCRDWESVILERNASDTILEDVTEFVSDEVKDWYRKHGMPYRRGYLFHGPPGTGTTSMISALASQLKRNVYKINIVAPRLCDDSLQAAISSVRPGSIIVMEDLDCMFNNMRE